MRDLTNLYNRKYDEKLDNISPIENVNYGMFDYVTVLNELDATMYNELYNFKGWPSIDFDMVTEKLSNDSHITFEDVYVWMKDFKINESPVQFIMVRTDLRLYTIYCNYFEAINYIRKHVLKQDISLISINVTTDNGYDTSDPNVKTGYYLQHDMNMGHKTYIEGPILSHHSIIVEFLDNQMKKHPYNYVYIPDRRPGSLTQVLVSSVYILDGFDDNTMLEFDKLRAELNSLNDQYKENGVYGFLEIGDLHHAFGKYPRDFWDGGL